MYQQIYGGPFGLYNFVRPEQTLPINTFNSSLCAVIGISNSLGTLQVYRPTTTLNPFTNFVAGSGYAILAHEDFVLGPFPTVIFVDQPNLTINVDSDTQYYFKVDSTLDTFDMTIDSIVGITFTNVYVETDYSQCKLLISPSPRINSSAAEVYVTDSVELSTDTNKLFTFTYFNTGSLILGFTAKGTTLVVPNSAVFLITPSTPTPTPTPTSTPTSSQVEVSSTPIPTSTSTSSPTPTPTLTPTSTQVGVSPTPTSTPTSTQVGISPTPTRTSTSTPSPTPTTTPTSTQVGVSLTPTPTPTVTPTETSSSSLSGDLLINPFDIENITNSTVLPTKYKGYLTQAAQRWNNLIKINSGIFDQLITIRGNLGETWNGMQLNNFTQFTETPTPGQGVTIASCGPSNLYDIITPGPTGTEFVAAKFNLSINDYFDNIYSEQEWVDVLTHELGHALGIGTFWNAFFEPYGAVPPSNNLLSGTAYTGALSAYNQITGLTRTKIPLESDGGDGTASAHWENSYRALSGTEPFYYGLSNELMIGYKTVNQIISQLTINSLVDMGYEERVPGTNEGTPNVVAFSFGLKTDSVNEPVKYSCNCTKIKDLNLAGTIYKN